MLARHRFAPVVDHALGKLSLFFDFFSEGGEKDSGISDDRYVHRRQFLKVAGPAANYDIFERDIDHFAAGFGRWNIRVRVGIRAHQRAVKIGHVQTHDHISVGDQFTVSAGEVQRMSVGKVQARAEIDYRNRQQVGQRH